MKTHTQRVKRFFATLLFSTLVLVFPYSPAANSLEDGLQAHKAGDYKKALEIFKPLAEQGDLSAQNYLGLIYFYGHGVFQDSSEAVKWYRKAAEQGLPFAQFCLGAMYASGEGVPQNRMLAHKWFDLAASRLSPGNKREIARKTQNIVEKKMTPTQIAESKKQAREWKPKPNKSS